MSAEEEAWAAWIARNRANEKVTNRRMRIVATLSLLVLMIVATLYLARY